MNDYERARRDGYESVTAWRNARRAQLEAEESERRRVVPDNEERRRMNEFKTEVGDRVLRYPETERHRDQIAVLRAEIAELFDAATAAQKREALMTEQGRAATAKRFRALG